MKRIFADLRLNLKSSASASRIINKAAMLGYRLVAVPLSPETRENETVTLRSMCSEAKIDFASRVDIKPKTHNDLMHQLRRLRRKFEVICVICENKEVPGKQPKTAALTS